jgi:hypothetical protein
MEKVIQLGWANFFRDDTLPCHFKTLANPKAKS